MEILPVNYHLLCYQEWGKATTDISQIERPNWTTVKDVIDGKKPLRTVSNTDYHMKNILKYGYYILFSISLIWVLVFTFAPMGGFGGAVWVLLHEGLYSNEFSNLFGQKAFYILNIIVAYIFFTSVALCFLSIFLFRKNKIKRYKFGVYSGLIMILVIVIGHVLNFLSN